MTKTYQITVVQGYSPVDHLAPIGISGTYPTLAAARKALAEGRKRNHKRSAEIRCDIVRSDGKRFEWQ